MSKLLADQFENKQVLTHPGGHFFPASSEHKPRYHEFLQDRLVEVLESRELKESNLAINVDNDAEGQDEDSD